MIINAREFGIIPGQDAARPLVKLAEYLKAAQSPCTVIFEPGTYPIQAENLPMGEMFVTNTVGDKEWLPGETPHENRAGFLLEGVSDAALEGNGAVFVLHGRATNLALINCHDVTLRGFRFTAERPDMHEFMVVKKGPFWVDFQMDPESSYVKYGGNFYFTGADYCTPFLANRIAGWIGHIDCHDPGILKRTGHPFFSALRIVERGDHQFRVYMPDALRFKIGERYELFDVRRKYNGIFIDRCRNITLEQVEQNFNYGLALVAQDSDTLMLSGLRFAPRPEGSRLMASVADFIQICMCRGQVTVRDSFFEGAGDDCLNAHGIHFKIVERAGETITVRFMHPQSHGFNPLRPGDRITFVNPDTLLCQGEATIRESELLDEYKIRLTLEGEITGAAGDVIEDIDASPDLTFERNTMDRIITRGLLLTVRGKVRIRENVFEHTTMNHILISDDAKSWYESGCVRDVRIEGNTFKYCPEHTVCIKPENRTHAGAVHTGIVIQNNTVRTPSYFVKSSDGVRIAGNRHEREPKLFTKDSRIEF